jgi:hypothetical protein
MNTFKTLVNRVVTISLVVFGLQVYAFSNAEDAIETESLRITLKDSNTGYVQGRICNECELLTVAVTAETKAFNKNNEVSLRQAAARAGKPATVFINIEHTQVTRIVW